MLNPFDKPNSQGEWPYDATEHFSREELAQAVYWRGHFCPTIRGRSDHCPHTPPCPNVPICLEEIAWYLRHRQELTR